MLFLLVPGYMLRYGKEEGQSNLNQIKKEGN